MSNWKRITWNDIKNIREPQEWVNFYNKIGRTSNNVVMDFCCDMLIDSYFMLKNKPKLTERDKRFSIEVDEMMKDLITEEYIQEVGEIIGNDEFTKESAKKLKRYQDKWFNID